MVRGAGWPCTDLFTPTRIPVTPTKMDRGERNELMQEGAGGLTDFLH